MLGRLVVLFNELEDSIPKCQLSKSNFVSLKDEGLSKECKVLFDHLADMGSIDVHVNRNGISVIPDTAIVVLSSLGFGPYISSRYGKLLIPTRVKFL